MSPERAHRVRLDRLLVDRGLADSREKAQAMILAGKVLVAEQKMSREEALAKAKEQGLRSEKYVPLVDGYLDLKAEKP